MNRGAYKAVVLSVLILGGSSTSALGQSGGRVTMSENTVQRGQRVSSSAAPFDAGTSQEWSVHLHPAACAPSCSDTPITVGNTTADSQRRTSLTWTVPRGLQPGSYQLEVRGSVNGSDTDYTVDFTVIPGAGDKLPTTGVGWSPLAAFAVAAAMLAVLLMGFGHRRPEGRAVRRR